MNKNIIYLVIIVLVIVALILIGPKLILKKPVAVNSFDECVAAGYPVQESYPEQCKTPDNKTFVEDIGNVLEKQNLIQITSPRPNDLIRSPLLLEGEARGTWYFEASFPIKIFDANGKQLGSVAAQAEGDWMTTEFVPFKATLQFETPTTQKGTLVLEKDNPSGLPQNADQLTIPIYFSK
jgi:hypothetical protein